MNNSKKERQLLETFRENPLTFYAALRMGMRHMNNKIKQLPPEEQDRREKERLARREEEARVAKIRNRICPDCSGKVIRGNKCKHNNYKRQFTCLECNTIHYV